MCRSIKTLHNYDPPASEDEVVSAARQYVRKISGYQKPSVLNEAVFAQSIDEIADATRRLIAGLQTTAVPRDREAEADRKRELAKARFG